MAMSKAEFRDALTAAASSEFSHIAADEESIDYTFSDRFEQKMEKLIRFQKKSYYRWINTAAKRVAVIALACVLLFVSAFSVEAVRVPIVEAVEQVKDVLEDYVQKFIQTHNGIGFNGDPTKTIDTKYVITDLPPGFYPIGTWTESDELTTYINYQYRRELGELIDFSQTVFVEDVGLSIGPNGEKLSVAGKEILFKSDKYGMKAYWVEEGKYLMSLHYLGEIEQEDFLAIVKSVKAVE